MPMKTLLCFVGKLQSTHLTIESIKTNLIQPLDADVLLCVCSDKPPQQVRAENELAKIAKYLFIYNDDNIGMSDTFDNMCSSKLVVPSWRSLLYVKDTWLGCLDDRPGTNAKLMFNKTVLLEEIEKIQKDNPYDWFIVTRTDLMWVGKHPSLMNMDPSKVYIPTGLDRDGYNDTHFVCSPQHVSHCLGALNVFLEHTQVLLDIFEKASVNNLNAEMFFKLILVMYHIPVSRFPSVAFRTNDDERRKLYTNYDPTLKYHYMDRDEMMHALNNAGVDSHKTTRKKSIKKRLEYNKHNKHNEHIEHASKNNA